MEDFASTSMIRLIIKGLSDQGIALALPASMAGAHVDLSVKRQILAHLVSNHGPTPILRIGKAIHHFPDDPMMVALSGAQDLDGLLNRWARLERFAHSRHRIKIVDQSHTGIQLRHASKNPDEPPRPEESMVIFGLLTALMQRIGLKGLRAKAVTDTGWRFDRDWQERTAPETTSTWIFDWQDQPIIQPRPMVAGSDINALQALLRRDPLQTWSVQAMARAMGQSTRSLQRRLQQSGESFTQIVARTRASIAAEALVHPEKSLAEIGFCSGYADQAHFTRSFKSATAMTPKTYRESFTYTA